ncbi:hypothetical protein COOONC_25744 [Cooperia oncophora]
MNTARLLSCTLRFRFNTQVQVRQVSTLVRSLNLRFPRKLLQNNAKTELSGWQLVRRLLRYVWPKGNRAIKSRVLVALCLLVGAKVSYRPVPH